MVVIAFSYYGRGKDVSPDAEPWQMLFATWRDSLIITLLFVAQNFLYRFSAFDGAVQSSGRGDVSYLRAYYETIGTFTIDVLIFVVCVLRIIAVTNWMRQRYNSTTPTDS